MAEWWEEAFRADYLRVYPHRDDAAAAAEVNAWLGRLPGLVRGARVLDLACGAGRHLRAMRAAGIRAVGADLSADLLIEARGRGAEGLVRCDMRRLPFRESAFDLVTCFFTSFGYFRTQEEDAAALHEAGRVLAVGGVLLLDLADPASTLRDLVPRTERTQGGVTVIEERRASANGWLIEKQVTLREGARERRWRESVHIYPPDFVEEMASGAGLRPLGRFGEHGPRPWRSGGTARCVMVLRKAAA